MFERPGSGRRLKRRDFLLFQEFFTTPGISSKSGWAQLLLNCFLSFGVQRRQRCVEGEGEVGAGSEGKVEGQALACQRLAEVQTLGGQGGFTFTQCSHFCVLLNYELSEGTR